MKIIPIGNLTDHSIIDLFTEIAIKYFDGIPEVTIGVIELINEIKVDHGRTAIAMSSSDLPHLVKLYSFLADLIDLNPSQKFFIVFDKTIYSDKDREKIIAHELRHIEQMVLFPVDLYRSEIIRSLRNNHIKPPSEKDTEAFETYFISKNGKRPEHTWREEVNNYFKELAEYIKIYHQDLKNQKLGIKTDGIVKITEDFGFNSLMPDEATLEYALYLFDKAKIEEV